MFKIRLKNKASSIKKRVESVFEETQKKVKTKLEKNFGKEFINDRMFQTGDVFKNRQKLSSSGGFGVSKTLMDQVKKEYVAAFEDRYEEIQRIHKAMMGGGESPHIRWKRENMGQPAWHNDQNISHSSWTLWTGMMHGKIEEAFQNGGNDYLSVGNLLVSGRYEMNLDQFPHLYETFTDWFVDQKIIQSSDGVVDFDDSHWKLIQSAMRDVVKKGFVQPVVDVFNKLELKV